MARKLVHNGTHMNAVVHKSLGSMASIFLALDGAYHNLERDGSAILALDGAYHNLEHDGSA